MRQRPRNRPCQGERMEREESVTEHQWLFINTFAPWFSAIGTSLAASVALYVAFQRGRLKIFIMCWIHEERDRMYTTSPPTRWMVVELQNRGDLKAHLCTLFWTVGMFHKLP